MSSTSVHVFPADAGGCGYFRLIWPAQALREAGHDVFINPPGTSLKGRAKDGVLLSMDVPDVDVFVFQRVTSRILLQGIEMLVKAGRRVVVDFDDDLRAVDARNPAYWAVHPSNETVNWTWAARAAEVASAVTVASSALLERYGYGHGHLVRNCVPSSYLKVEREPHDSVTVGWAGNLATHPGDPSVMRGGLAMALRDAREAGVDSHFGIVGEAVPGLHQAFGLDPSEPVETPGHVDFDDYPRHYARFDVAVAPLNDTVFNQSKSYLKGIEAAALGVPVVMSALPEYEWLAAQGIGQIAKRPRDWHRLLRRLLVEHEFRTEQAALGRERAARFTIEGNIETWERAWLG